MPPEPSAPEIAAYRESPVDPALRSVAVCVWAQTIGPGDLPCRFDVLPDGCIDLVWAGERPPVVAGPATGVQEVTLPSGTQVLGVRFRPGMASLMLGVPAVELRDRSVSLDALWGAEADRITARMHELPSRNDRFAWIERALLSRSPEIGDAERLVLAATSALSRDPASSVEAVARELHVSVRQLHRHFTTTVGYGPKRFQRIVRFQHLLALARRSPPSIPLASLALEVGYSDQAHMTREVRELAATVPSELLGRFDSTLILSDLFKTPPAPRS